MIVRFKGNPPDKPTMTEITNKNYEVVKCPPTTPTEENVTSTPLADPKETSKTEEPMEEDEDMDWRVADWDKRVSIPVILNKRKI